MWPAMTPEAGLVTESGAEPATVLEAELVIEYGAEPATEPGVGPVIEPEAGLADKEKSPIPIVICHNN